MVYICLLKVTFRLNESDETSLSINIYKPYETVLFMALLKALCWALIFILRIRFPPGTSIAMHISYVYVYSKILNAIPNAKLELDSVYFSIMRKLIK